MRHFIVMGVSGCGKSTIAERLALNLKGEMIEADELHGSENVAKMHRGEALTDDDRWPWLIRVANELKASKTPVFVSCSALRRVYRECLLKHAQVPIDFIHLHTEPKVIEARLSNREGHFMPLSLFKSQLHTLEPIQSDEQGVVVDINQSIDDVVGEAMAYVKTAMKSTEKM